MSPLPRVFPLGSSLLVIAATARAAPPSAIPASTPEPVASAEPDEPDEPGGYLEEVTGGGTAVRLDLRLGWMVRSWAGAFVSAGTVLSGESGARMIGAGARTAHGRWFADAQIEYASWELLCRLEEPCGTRRRVYGIVGAGAKVLRSRHVALEIRADRMQGRDEGFTLVGLGIGFFL
jgi:hypothetical protein